MRCEALFQKIDELNADYLRVWEEICNIESPTAYKAGVDAVGAYCSAMARERGWTVEIQTQSLSGDVVCITMNPDAKRAPISLSGHMDTVHPVGMFGTPAARIEGDKIYGPGVEDCKGGVIAGLLAMDALRLCGFVDRPIRLLLQSDEETGSKGSGKTTIGYICEKAKDSVAFLNLEGFKSGTATVQRKGIVSFRFTVKGKEGHSALCAQEGANAIVDAAHKLIDLDRLKDHDGITCNCALVEGGTVLNTIPGTCSFSVNFRYATQEQLDWIDQYVKQLAATSHVKGCQCTVERIGMRVAMEYKERNVELLRTMNRIFAENGLPELAEGKSNGGSDAADVTVYGIPCIDSLGVYGGKIHSIDEFAYISSLAEAAKRLACVIYCMP